MQSPLSEPEVATVTSENPLTITYHHGIIAFPASHIGHYTPRKGDTVLASYHHTGSPGHEDHIILGLLAETGNTPDAYTAQPAPAQGPA